MTVTREEVLDALAGVRDPELDEPITTLGFVSDITVKGAGEVAEAGSEVEITLRLPTFFCSPNFAYIMAEDAHRSLLALPAVSGANVFLENFHVGEEIESGVGSGSGFDEAFSGFSDTSGEDLDEVRDTFKRKAFIRRQEILCRALMGEGSTPEELAGMTVGGAGEAAAAVEELAVYLDRRAELGFDTGPRAPLLLSMYGSPVPEGAVIDHLRRAKLTRISVEGNGMFCQELLKTRYAKERSRLGA